MLWFATNATSYSYNTLNINPSMFYLSISPTSIFDQNKYQIDKSDIIDTNIKNIKNWCNTTTKLPNNPLVIINTPPFMKNIKFNELLNLMVPNDSIKTVNKGYLDIISSEYNIKENPLIITFCMDPN